MYDQREPVEWERRGGLAQPPSDAPS
jgi:hypothetical protein